MKKEIILNFALLTVLLFPTNNFENNQIYLQNRVNNIQTHFEKEVGEKIEELLEETEKVEETEEIIIDTEEETKKDLNTELETYSDLRKLSNLESYQYDNLLRGTNLHGIGSSFKEAEDKYNINGLYLVGLACLESGYGKSSYAIERNNITGYCAYDTDTDSATYFETKNECILETAKLLKEKFLDENNWRFEGYTARDIDVHYCSDKTHADKIISIVKTLINDKGVD